MSRHKPPHPAARRTLAACLSFALALLFTATPPPPPAVAQGVDFLPPEVEELFRKHRIAKQHTGLLIKSVDGKVLATHQASTPFNPASVVKVLTALAALDILGVEHKWETAFAAEGKINDGVLDGDLILIGGGDPYLTSDDFLHMLAGLRSRGLREVRGNLVIDDSIYDLPPHNPATFDGAPAKPYNVGGGGIVINFKTQEVFFSATAAGGGKVRVHTEPPNAHFALENKIKHGKVRCRNWRGKIREQLADEGSTATLRLSGTYSHRCGEQSFYLSVLNPRAHAAGVFGAMWQQLGGEWSGKWRQGKAGAGAVTLLVRPSPPLPQVLTAMNKHSNNVMARNVFLSLAGAGDAAPPHTPAAAHKVFAEWLHAKGTPDVVVENGSGLSRKARITPAQMTQLLEAAWRHPYRAELISSLPVSGKDGTLQKRMHARTAGMAHLKTGSLAGVTTISGFIRTHSGDYLMLTLFTKRQSGGRVQRLQNDLVRHLTEISIQ